MSAVPQIKYLTPEEYLAIERQAEYKSDYVDGVMYAMAGGSWIYTRIAGLDQSVELNTITSQLKLKDVYAKTESL